MADHTKIEWSQATWNVVTGCTRVSEGCDHCYIERTPPFRIAGRRFDKPGIGGSTGVVLHPDRLTLPLRWRKPRRIFVNSLSDLFHDDVPDGLIVQVLAMAYHCPRHTFQVLTKRPARMRSIMRRWVDTIADQDVGGDGLPPMPRGPRAHRAVYTSGRAELFASMLDFMGEPPPGAAYPLYDWMEGMRWWPSLPHNLWLGVSVETQHWADVRVPTLWDTPAAVRWLSCEPLLGPIDLDKPGWLWNGDTDSPGGISWVVAGGESGPRARAVDADWVRSLRDQCVDAGVPFFFKQAGSALAREWGCIDPKGGNPAEWPEYFPREYPDAAA